MHRFAKRIRMAALCIDASDIWYRMHSFSPRLTLAIAIALAAAVPCDPGSEVTVHQSTS
jgi:hypothetical protein